VQRSQNGVRALIRRISLEPNLIYISCERRKKVVYMINRKADCVLRFRAIEVNAQNGKYEVSIFEFMNKANSACQGG